MIGPISGGLRLLGAALFFLSFFGSAVASVMLNSRMVRVLQSKHHALWLDLGAPGFWHVLLFGSKPGGGIAARSAGANLASKYFTWLSLEGYKDVDDSVVTETGKRLGKLFWQTVILMIAGVVCFCSGYFLHRVPI
jgi:hypothetical protein